MEEQRKARRAPFSGRIEQLVRHGSDYPRMARDDEYFEAQAINISRRGLACSCAASIEPLSHVFVAFTLDEGRTIKADCYVAHANAEGGKYVLGLSFEGLSPEDDEAIEAYVASRA
jgi:hypothetical protein